jgi:hypothetical protein
VASGHLGMKQQPQFPVVSPTEKALCGSDKHRPTLADADDEILPLHIAEPVSKGELMTTTADPVSMGRQAWGGIKTNSKMMRDTGGWWAKPSLSVGPNSPRLVGPEYKGFWSLVPGEWVW